MTSTLTGFRIHDLHCRLGFDCSSLPPSAHTLEQSLEFERAARAEFARVFDLWKQDRSFVAPFTAPASPSVVPRVDAHGDFDPADVEAMAREHLRAHVRGPSTLEVEAAGTSICYFDVITRTWVIIHGFHVEIDGQRYVADPLIDAFAADYRAGRSQIAASFDADCALLRPLPVVLFVSWPR